MKMPLVENCLEMGEISTGSVDLRLLPAARGPLKPHSCSDLSQFEALVPGDVLLRFESFVISHFS